MRKLAWVLIVLSALTFILGAIGALVPMYFYLITPEGFSRASSNLALIAIALLLMLYKNSAKG
jgi:hypothetical protein